GRPCGVALLRGARSRARPPARRRGLDRGRRLLLRDHRGDGPAARCLAGDRRRDRPRRPPRRLDGPRQRADRAVGDPADGLRVDHRRDVHRLDRRPRGALRGHPAPDLPLQRDAARRAPGPRPPRRGHRRDRRPGVGHRRDRRGLRPRLPVVDAHAARARVDPARARAAARAARGPRERGRPRPHRPAHGPGEPAGARGERRPRRRHVAAHGPAAERTLRRPRLLQGDQRHLGPRRRRRRHPRGRPDVRGRRPRGRSVLPLGRGRARRPAARRAPRGGGAHRGPHRRDGPLALPAPRRRAAHHHHRLRRAARRRGGRGDARPRRHGPDGRQVRGRRAV
ncbi:MAG: hypothetical protein AVDCRST_MAG30-2433, partial [uncultured Solirubrobacteraceae bacterium]